MKSMRTFYYCFTVLVVLSTVLCGCNRNPGLSGLVPVSGVLTHEGNPVEGATIIFGPAPGSPAENKAASATTDALGQFTLMTLLPNDGVHPGTYQVAVSKTELTGGDIVAGSDPKKPKFHDQKRIDYLPPKYREAETSGIEITIPPKGTKTIEINLEGKIDTNPQEIRRR